MPEPKTADDNFKKWFGSSQVVDAAGEPMVVYHSSVATFDKFRVSRKDLGIHFGTAGQAEDRFLLKQHHEKPAALARMTPCTLPVYLSIAKPLRMPDLGDWDLDDLVGNLPAEFTFHERIYADKDSHAGIRKLIESHGYDGIVYTNDMEARGAHVHRLAQHAAFEAVLARFPQSAGVCTGEEAASPEYVAYLKAIQVKRDHMKTMGEDSWIAFSPTQVKSAIGNSGLFNRRSADLTDLEGHGLQRARKAQGYLSALNAPSVSP